MRPFRSVSLPVTPWAYFLYEQKVCKESQKGNRARFPFESLQERAKLRLSSVVFVSSLFLQKSLSAMLNIAPSSGGSRRGIAIPLLSLRVRVHRERGNRNTLSLCVSLVTFSTSRKSPHGVTGSRSLQMSQANPPHYRKTPVPRKNEVTPKS